MKKIVSLLIVLVSTSVYSQKPCDFVTKVNDSIGTYSATREYLMYEKNFAGKSEYIFNSLIIADGVPTLNVQILEKSADFIKTKCFDKNSRVYLQLQNGKIITLIHLDKDICGNLIRDKETNNRILSGNFLFQKSNIELLKESPVNFIRIKFSTESQDYIIKKEFLAELDEKTYQPEDYFINYFHCIDEAN